MIGDLFVPTPAAGATTNQIANAAFVASALASAGVGTVVGLSVLGNASTASAVVAPIVAATANALLVSNAGLTTVAFSTLSDYLDVAVGSTNGALLARNAATWIALPPAWSTYTPSLASGNGTLTAVGTRTGRYTQIGKTVFVSIDVAITTNGTGSNFLNVGLPVASQGVVALSGREVNVTGKMIFGSQSGAAGTIVTQYYDATYPGANNGRYLLGGSYEVP